MALQKRNENAKKTIVCHEMANFIESAILEGSFFLIHDIITLIDEEAFCPMLDTANTLIMVGRALTLKWTSFVIKFDDIEQIKQGCEAIINLDKYLCEVKRKHDVHAHFSIEIFQIQLNELLFETLTTNIQNTRLISKIFNLNLLPEKDIHRTLNNAFGYYIKNDLAENARLLNDMNLVPKSFLENECSHRFYIALTQKNLKEAQFLYTVNENKSPLDDDQLGSFFVRAVDGDHVELLKFIHSIAGEIKEIFIKQALHDANLLKSAKVLEYLKTYVNLASSVNTHLALHSLSPYNDPYFFAKK